MKQEIHNILKFGVSCNMKFEKGKLYTKDFYKHISFEPNLMFILGIIGPILLKY